MSKIDTSYLQKCILTLDKAYGLLQKTDSEEIDYEIYRSACVKEFEIILEQCGKLNRKSLKLYLHSSKAVDRLYFKDVFKQAVLRSIITPELCENFLMYRDNRNITAHDYGVNFAEETLHLLPQFIEDAYQICEALNQINNATEE